MKENEDIEEAVVTVHKMTEDEKMRRLADLREKAIMDEKAIRRKGYEDGHEAGYEDGKSKGLAEGRTQGRKEGREEGLEEGREEGRSESQRNIAKKLRDMGMSIKDIEQITELSKEEIEKL